jgi:antitoxin VapB
MAVLIRARRVDEKIRELAKRTGRSLTEAVEAAVDKNLAETAPKPRGRVDREGLARAQAYFSSLPRINEDLTDDEIIGYNEDGNFD